MAKTKFFKIIVITSLSVSILAFLYASVIGGCNIRTEVKNIDNPQNLDVEIKPAECVRVFSLVNHEEGLILYAVRGDIVVSDDGKSGVLNNVLLCLKDISSSQWSRDFLKPVDDAQLCSPINLNINQGYSIPRIKNYWEIITNKGSIKGYTEYSESSFIPIMASVSKISGIIFIISLILLIFLKKRKKGENNNYAR